MSIRIRSIQVDQVPRPLLAVLMTMVLAASLSFETACPLTQSDLQKAESIIAEVIQAIPTILQLVATFGQQVPPNVVSAATNYANQAKTDVALAQTLLAQYTAANAVTTVQKINAALADAQANLSAILTAFHVVSAQTVAYVQAAVGATIGAVAAVESLVAALAVKAKASSGAMKAAKANITVTAKQFRNQFNAALANAGHPELALK